MPDLSRKNMRAMLDLNMTSLARIHKYYMAGFTWAIESEQEVRKANEFIENIEKLLVGTGFMTQSEVDARHVNFKNDLSVENLDGILKNLVEIPEKPTR